MADIVASRYGSDHVVLWSMVLIIGVVRYEYPTGPEVDLIYYLPVPCLTAPVAYSELSRRERTGS